jgi:hypothetical protein
MSVIPGRISPTRDGVADRRLSAPLRAGPVPCHGNRALAEHDSGLGCRPTACRGRIIAGSALRCRPTAIWVRDCRGTGRTMRKRSSEGSLCRATGSQAIDPHELALFAIPRQNTGPNHANRAGHGTTEGRCPSVVRLRRSLGLLADLDRPFGRQPGDRRRGRVPVLDRLDGCVLICRREGVLDLLG